MKPMRWMAAATCVAVLLAWTARATADVLEQVPTDALVVFKINNLKSTSDKIAKFSQDLGLAHMEPRMGDPLGFMQQQAQMTQGVNTAGELAFVLLDPEKTGADEDESWLVLVPVSDYQAFLANFPDAESDGAVSQVQIAGTPQPQYSANWGNYAAISPSKQLVASKPTNVGLTFPAVTTRELNSKDAIFVANFKALAPRVKPRLRENREKLLADIQEGMAEDPNAEKFAPVVGAIVNQALNLADQFLSDTDAAVIGFSMTDDGILASAVADFRSGTKFGQIMEQAKSTADDKLAGLPAGKYLFFGGSVNDPEATARLMDDIAQPVLKEVLAIGPEFKAAQDYYDGLKMYISASKGNTVGLLAPTGALGAEALLQGVTIHRGDPQQMLEGYRKMVQSQPELMAAVGIPADQMKLSYTQNAKTVEGVTFDSFKSEFNLDPADPSAAQAEQFMTMFYGPEGATVMMGAVNDEILVQAIGLREETLAKMVTSARAGASPLSDLPGVKAVRANLPKENLGVFYVPVDEIVNTALNYARQFNMPMQVQLPPDLPPIGAAVATEGPALRFDLYIPSQLVQSLVAAGMQAAMQMQGGGPGGGL